MWTGLSYQGKKVNSPWEAVPGEWYWLNFQCSCLHLLARRKAAAEDCCYKDHSRSLSHEFYHWNRGLTLPRCGSNKQCSTVFLTQDNPPRKVWHLRFITQRVVKCQTVTYLSLNKMRTKTHSKNSYVKQNKGIHFSMHTNYLVNDILKKNWKSECSIF